MPDGWEVTYSLDPTKDDGDLDTDNDGIVYFINNVEYKDAFTNKEEYLTGEDIDGDGIIDRNTTDPTNPDTDGDKENDYHELWFSDDDDDTLVNGWELIFNGTSNNPDGYVPFNLELTKGKLNPNNWDSDGDFDSDGEEDYDDDQWNNTHEQFTQSPENKNIFYIENAPGCSDPSDDSMTPITVRATSRSGQAQARSVQIDSSEHSRTQTFSIKRTFSRQIILLHPITYQYNRLILMMNIFNQIKIDDIICVLINSNKMEYLKK